MTICAFSKHFHWASVDEMASICASLGYEGIDLTVRRDGHIEPATVADELPKAVAVIQKAGLSVPMVTAGITDASSPHAEAILKTLKSLGISRYRWGGFRYDESSPLESQLAEFKKRAAGLAAMNAHYGVCAMYHTHSGIGQVGASMWDLYLILKDLDRNAVSVNYDLGHATVEGGYGGWIHSSRLMLPHSRGIAVKDFRWKQNAKGQWVPGWCALGEGMVNFARFFPMMKASGFNGPLQLHMEYDELGGADSGKRQFSIPKEKLLAIMRRDIDRLKSLLREAGVRS
jgi:sugar phosphate isomerase/epimerase